jgi:hypothetical protein
MWQAHPEMDDPKQKRFLRGVLLIWIPLLPLIFTSLNSLRGITEQKATGLGAVAGGLAEIYVPLGLVLTVVSLLTGTVLLFRAFSREHWPRSFFSVVSICVAGFALLVLGLFLWLVFSQLHHRS